MCGSELEGVRVPWGMRFRSEEPGQRNPSPEKLNSKIVPVARRNTVAYRPNRVGVIEAACSTR